MGERDLALYARVEKLEKRIKELEEIIVSINKMTSNHEHELTMSRSIGPIRND